MIKKNYSYFIYFILFFFVFYFFAKIHPLYVFDTDDWLYIQDSRGGKVWPVRDLWNPTKILPEFLMPVVSWISVIFIYSISNDYIQSLAIGFALCLSFFVILAAFLLEGLLKSIIKELSFGALLCVVLFVILLLFPIFRKDNVYLLKAENVTCIFNYTIPALLNISVCYYLLSLEHKAPVNDNYKKLGWLFIVLYFSLNSNLFHSIILVSLACSSLLFSLIPYLTKSNNFCLLRFFKENYIVIGIILYWLIVLLFEANGERASIANSGLLSLNYLDCLSSLWLRLKRLHDVFFFLLLTNFFGLLFYLFKSKKNKLQKEDIDYLLVIKKLFISFIITLVFIFMLCAKISASYIARPEVAISFLIILLSMSLISVMYLLKQVNMLVAFFPLFVLLVALYSIFYPVKYDETSFISAPVSSAKQISSDIIDQIIEADRNGLNNIDIRIPKFNGDNFPFADYGVVRIPKALYYHSITRKLIDVNFITDISINKRYNLN